MCVVCACSRVGKITSLKDGPTIRSNLQRIIALGACCQDVYDSNTGFVGKDKDDIKAAREFV